jgi:hypothetical protein
MSSAERDAALPWEDPDERGPGHPNWSHTCDWGHCWSHTCDWGHCNAPSVTMRWEDREKQWLAVCADHAPDRAARCAALPPHHEPWECE